ncbi:MAG: hypothetical protein ACP5M4_07700 [Acidobacteriaceae bacterium]
MSRDDLRLSLCGLAMAFVGLLGLALIASVRIALSGISPPVSWVSVILDFGSAMVGPVMFLAGGLLYFLNLMTRFAAKVGLVGEILATLWVAGFIGLAIVQASHPSTNPGIDSSIHWSDAILYAALVIVDGVTDWAAPRALRLSRN